VCFAGTFAIWGKTAQGMENKADIKVTDVAAPAIAAPVAESAKILATDKANHALKIDPAKLKKKTPGEKYYDVLQFLSGKAFIVVVSAFIAYEARYGKETWGKMPNLLKKFQDGFEYFLSEKLALKKVGKDGELGKYISGAAAATTLTMWGGNLFAPFLKWFENSKETIANNYNKKHGTPEHVAIAHERLKDEPKQTWGDVIKGRFVGWVIVCSAFVGGNYAFGKSKKTGMRRLEAYEEWFGRKIAGWTQAGKEIAKTPLTKELLEEQKKNKMYRFGRIVALDFFATSTAIVLWNAISRGSARKRARVEKALYDVPDLHSFVDPIPEEQPQASQAAAIPVAETTAIPVKPRIEPKLAEGYVKMTSAEPSAASPSL
jgi:hypothetical protein